MTATVALELMTLAMRLAWLVGHARAVRATLVSEEDVALTFTIPVDEDRLTVTGLDEGQIKLAAGDTLEATLRLYLTGERRGMADAIRARFV